MRVRGEVVRQLFEAAESVGVDTQRLSTTLGFDRAALRDPRGQVEWAMFTAIAEEISIALDGDIEALRSVGRALVRAPSFGALQTLARRVISPRTLFEIGTRWIAPVSFPHLTLEQTFPSEDCVYFLGRIPEPFATSAAFFHVVIGVWVGVPTLLGLPPATLLHHTVTPRTVEATLRLPRPLSLLSRAGRALRAVAYSAVGVDVLEEQRSQLTAGLEALKRATGEIQALFDRLPDLVIIHRDGIILWRNRAALQTLGYREDCDLLGRSIFEIVDPVSHETLRLRMQMPVGDDTMPEVTPTWLVARNGQRIQVEVAPSQVVTFNSRPARLVVARDVTERSRMQQRLITADRLAAIGLLAAGVAHEVNNPLAYVLNNVELARRQLLSLGEPAQPIRDALATALEGVERIRTIVRDLLALARVDERIPGAVDVCAVVDSTLTLAGPDISACATLVRDYDTVALAQGTDARLGQVILNLVVNALEAMRDGARATNQLRITIRNGPGGTILVDVSDNGVGISTEHSPRIFEPFYTTKPFGGGTGMGLSISQRLVAEMGGELSVSSSVGKGSTFRITLQPAEPPAGQAHEIEGGAPSTAVAICAPPQPLPNAS